MEKVRGDALTAALEARPQSAFFSKYHMKRAITDLPTRQLTALTAQALPATPSAAYRLAMVSLTPRAHALDAQVVSFPTREFDEKYPPDPPGEESSEHARVWKVYRDEAWKWDEKRLDGWNKTLDNLLIFAGLYSAVVTAFLIESYRKLSEDPTDYLAAVVFRVISAGSVPVTSPDTRPAAPPGSGFRATALISWVNGLWFSSLILTLSVALLCLLAKQWLTEYEAVVFASAPTTHYWTRRHMFHSEALRSWGVTSLISFLPTFLHLALFVFIIGLDLFLIPIHLPIAISIAVIGSIVLLFYLSQVVLSIIDPLCAFRSPLTAQMRAWATRVVSLLRGDHDHAQLRLSHREKSPSAKAGGRQAPEDEEEQLERLAPMLDAFALLWLMPSSTRSVASIAIQAIGSLRPSSETAWRLHRHGSHRVFQRYLAGRGREMQNFRYRELSSLAVVSETTHCLKALLCVTRPGELHQVAPFADYQPHQTWDSYESYLFRTLVVSLINPYYGIPAFVGILEETLELPHGDTLSLDDTRRSTLLILLDHVVIHHGSREDDGHDTARIVSSSSQQQTPISPECIAVILYLTHALGILQITEPDAHIIETGLRQCASSIQATDLDDKTAPIFPDAFTSRSYGFLTKVFPMWVCLALNFTRLKLNKTAELLLARDIADMARKSVSFQLPDRVAPKAYWDFINCTLSLQLPWTPSHLDDLIAPCLARISLPLVREEPFTRRSVATLLGQVNRLGLSGSQLISGGTFIAFFAEEVLKFSWSEMANDTRDITDFVDRKGSPDSISAWATLHNVVCSNGQVNLYVVNLAIRLASALRSMPAEVTAPNPTRSDLVKEFFAAEFLMPCIHALYRQRKLSQPSGLTIPAAFELMADCAYLSTADTARQMCDAHKIPVTETFTDSERLGLLRMVYDRDPRLTQVTTMDVFRNSGELSRVPRLTEPSLSKELEETTVDLPYDLVKSSIDWDFWSIPNFPRHLDILDAAREFSRQALSSQTRRQEPPQTVQVPLAVASLFFELLAQSAVLTPFHDEAAAPHQENVEDYLKGLEAYQRAVSEQEDGHLSDYMNAIMNASG